MRSFATRIISSLLAIYSAAGRNDSEPVEVHFVPHSHMDAGWLSTYDQYYE